MTALTDQFKTTAKGTVTTAITGFVIANPLISALLAGMGLAVWLTLRMRSHA